jgi:anti-sigma factor RsiW
LQLLIDRELIGEDEEQSLAHLETCPDCQRELEEMEAYSRRVRAARPQVQAPASLRQRVENSFAQAQSTRGPSQSAGIQIVTRKRSIGAWWFAAAAAMFFAVVALTLLVMSQRRQNVNLLSSAVIRAQQDLEKGKLPLDITTDSPQQVSDWFGAHLSFPFHMANAGIASDDRAKYKLVGGRLMSVNGEQAALLSFRLSDEQVSLIVVPGSLPIDTCGTAIPSDGVTLHAHDQDDMHVVSWRNRGLSYGLAFRATTRVPGTCARCHRENGSGNQGNRLSTQLVSPSPSLCAQLLATATDASFALHP